MPRGSTRYVVRPWADWSLAGDLAIDFAGREDGLWGEYLLYDPGGVFGVRIYENEDLLHDPLLDLPMDRYFEPEYRKLRVLLYACLGGDELDRQREALLAAFIGTVLIRAEGDPPSPRPTRRGRHEADRSA